MKKFPDKELHNPKGVIISTYWNDKELALLREFMKKNGLNQDSTAIKQGFLFGSNLIDTLSNGSFNIQIKAKNSSDKKK